MDPTTAPAAGTAAASPTTAAQAAASTAPAPGLEFQAMSPEQFKARLDAERKAAQSALLKDLGVESPDALKAALDADKKRREAEMSEAQKLQARLAELEPQAKRATDALAVLTQTVAADLGSLPEQVRKFIEATTPNDDPIAMRRAIDAARASGLGAVAAAQSAQPANLKAAGTNPAPAQATQPKDPRTMTPAEYAAYKAQVLAEIAAPR